MKAVFDADGRALEVGHTAQKVKPRRWRKEGDRQPMVGTVVSFGPGFVRLKEHTTGRVASTRPHRIRMVR